MKQLTTEQIIRRNQQRCKKCDRIVGCDYRSRKHKCSCNQEGQKMKKCKCEATEFQVWYSDFNKTIKIYCTQCKTEYSGEFDVSSMPDAD